MNTEREESEWSDLGTLWREQRVSAFAEVDVAAIRTSSDRFAKKVRARNLTELVAAALLVVFGSIEFFRAPQVLLKLGMAAMVLGAIAVTAVLLTRGKNLPPPPDDAPTREVIDHARTELERQADLLERVWLWYLLPVTPSMFLVYGHALVEAIAAGKSIWGPIGLFAGTAAFFVFVYFLNLRSARKHRALAARFPREATRE